MTTAANFKTIFQGAGWDVNNSVELVTTHGIKTMSALRRVTPERAGKMAMDNKKPGGGLAGHQVTEIAEHGLMMLAVIARHMERVMRTRTCAELKTIHNDADSYSFHESQMKMEAN